jgi:hypothetical protein
MNAMTCQEVEEHLDLLAAHECDRPTRRAVEQHLETCPACAASYAESQRLQGLLELHWNEADRLESLHRRLAEADRQMQRPRRVARPWMKQVASLAALVLVTFGLALLLTRWNEPLTGNELALAATFSRENDLTRAEVMKIGPPPTRVEVPPQQRVERGFRLTLPQDQRGAAYEAELRRWQREGKLPPPPAFGLELKLSNHSSRPLDVQLGDDTELRLDVQGPSVLRLPAPAGAKANFLQPQSWRTLAPGQERSLLLERLIDGSRRRLEYIYLTEPGDYTLTIHLRALVNREPTWVTSGVLRLKVE